MEKVIEVLSQSPLSTDIKGVIQLNQLISLMANLTDKSISEVELTQLAVTSDCCFVQIQAFVRHICDTKYEADTKYESDTKYEATSAVISTEATTSPPRQVDDSKRNQQLAAEEYENSVLTPFLAPIIDACKQSSSNGQDVCLAAINVVHAEYGISIPEPTLALMREIEEQQIFDIDWLEMLYCIKRPARKQHPSKGQLAELAMENLSHYLQDESWKCRLCDTSHKTRDNHQCKACGLPRNAFGLSSEQVTAYAKRALQEGAPGLRINRLRGVLSSDDLLRVSHAAELNAMLRKNSTLTEMAVNADGDAAIAALLEGLGAHPKLHWITITESGAAAKASEVLGDVIKHTKTLTGLAASKNNFDNQAIANIAAGIAESESGTLATLQVSSNAIQDQGAASIAAAVAGRSEDNKLQLQISGNPISDDGMMALLGESRLVVSGGKEAFLDTKKIREFNQQQAKVQEMIERDKAETESLLSKVMSEINNRDAMIELTRHQQTVFQQALASETQSGFEDSQERLRKLADGEANRLLSETIRTVIGQRYRASSQRWCSVVGLETFDPPQRQIVPNAVADDESYLDLILLQASWIKPSFDQICEALGQIFNNARSTEEICKMLGLPPQEFPLPLRSEALRLAGAASNQVVRIIYGPPKDRHRAQIKSSPHHQKWLQDDEKFPSPKGQHCLTDLVRATFVFGDPFVLALMIHALKTNFEVTRMVNRLCDDNPTQPPNVNMNLKVNGFVVEVQFLLEDILTIKNSLHKFYDILRAKTLLDLAKPVFDLTSLLPEFAHASQMETAAGVIHRYANQAKSATGAN